MENGAELHHFDSLHDLLFNLFKLVDPHMFQIINFTAAALHAHIISAVAAREFLRAFKRFENVWSAFSRTQARNVHVCSCLYLQSMPGSLVSSQADSTLISTQY